MSEPVANIAEYTVSEISAAVKRTVEDNFAYVRVRGEISGYRGPHSSGHAYFSLKDDKARLEAVVWRTTMRRLRFKPEEGLEVIATGKITTFPGSSKYQIVIETLEPAGLGALMAQLEERKRRLAAEGLFAEERKRPLPFLPRRIGLVTGRASAAERDVLQNARLRWPAVRFAVRNVAVQGVHAVPQVIEAVRELDAVDEVDVIVVARGGGSVEDLLPFSDEQLVRAVAACRTPVVSAIGHEPDNPLLDHVADLRASTPTDAAKKVVPDVGEEYERVRMLRDRARRCVEALVDREERGLAHALARPSIQDPHRMIDARAEEVTALLERGRRSLRHQLDRADSELTHTHARVVALSPAATLRRGYAVLQRSDGHAVRAPDEVAPGDELRARVSEGEFTVRVDT